MVFAHNPFNWMHDFTFDFKHCTCRIVTRSMRAHCLPRALVQYVVGVIGIAHWKVGNKKMAKQLVVEVYKEVRKVLCE